MNLRSETKTAGLFLLLAWGAAGCASREANQHQSTMTTTRYGPRRAQAVVYLTPTRGSKTIGTVTFTPVTDGVRVVAGMTGLAPGLHAFHIHENGDCSAPDASSAGGHYNPTGMPHGGPGSMNRHIGDMGNFAADANGEAHLDFVDTHLTLSGPYSIIGHALIVHAGADDYVSQPAGNSGPRVACGVIMSR
ncbi:MAG: superoxide dismutase copper/zinc binding protein [Pedosphaera sp.]|nr:superoxide dismutase copper/zinc binding protein [Pedosphaera sp.]